MLPYGKRGMPEKEEIKWIEERICKLRKINDEIYLGLKRQNIRIRVLDKEIIGLELRKEQLLFSFPYCNEIKMFYVFEIWRYFFQQIEGNFGRRIRKIYGGMNYGK